MDLWEVLGLLGVFALWGLLGLVPWCVALIAARGRVRLWRMPLAFAAGVGGGALVPALGGKDALGFGLGLLAALAAGAVVSISAMRMHGHRLTQMSTDE